MPLNLGKARIQQYDHTLIHYFDLNPIILEINKLHIKSKNLSDIINKNQGYSHDNSNYIKILKFTKEKVESKLREIIPHPHRTRRGLINGLGSIFKAITGNLDASDGERYENLIKDIQNNQNKLSTNILKENSISLQIIDKFNQTVHEISHNEILLQSKINQIAAIVEQRSYRENSLYIKDIQNQLINMYEIINSILQDIETSILFAKLNIMHPSIIKTSQLYVELLKIQKELKLEQLPLEITLDNTLLFENLIKIECFILNNKITYLLHVPIMYPFTFDYYHLYSVPVFAKSQFKAIIPRNKYLLKNELYYIFQQDSPCIEIKPQYHICQKLDIQEIKEDSACEIQLLNAKLSSSTTCQYTNIKISKPIIKQLEKSNQWIGLFPQHVICKLKCYQQEEITNLIGTYLFEIPAGCSLETPDQSIKNVQHSLNLKQPILFPDLNQEINITHLPNITIHLEETKLDELQEIKTQIIQNQPDLYFGQVSHVPSSWTITIYALLVVIIGYQLVRKIRDKYFKREEAKIEETGEAPTTVQLPRS